MAYSTDVLHIKVGFSVIIIDSLIIYTPIDELNGEALLGDFLRQLEERKILKASRLIQETSKPNFTSGIGIRRVLNVVELFETSWGDQSSAAWVNWKAARSGSGTTGGTRGGTVGRMRDSAVGWTRNGTVGRTREGTVGWTGDGTIARAIELMKVTGYKSLRPAIHRGYRNLRLCSSKVRSRRDKIDVSLEIVRNGICSRSQFLSTGNLILIVVECGVEKSVRRGDRCREKYTCTIVVCAEHTSTLKPFQDSRTRITRWRKHSSDSVTIHVSTV